MSRRHEERYKRALSRITQGRRDNIQARVLKELGFVDWPKAISDILNVQRQIAIKLGERNVQA